LALRWKDVDWSAGRIRVRQTKLDTSHRLHDLRHTFGTRMAAAGVPMSRFNPGAPIARVVAIPP
jgi:integrase